MIFIYLSYEISSNEKINICYFDYALHLQQNLLVTLWIYRYSINLVKDDWKTDGHMCGSAWISRCYEDLTQIYTGCSAWDSPHITNVCMSQRHMTKHHQGSAHH